MYTCTHWFVQSPTCTNVHIHCSYNHLYTYTGMQSPVHIVVRMACIHDIMFRYPYARVYTLVHTITCTHAHLYVMYIYLNASICSRDHLCTLFASHSHVHTYTWHTCLYVYTPLHVITCLHMCTLVTLPNNLAHAYARKLVRMFTHV